MRPSRSFLLLVAAPPVAASFAVLAFGEVGKGVWLTHMLAIGLAGALALTGDRLIRLARPRYVAPAILLVTLAGVAAPLLRDAPGPRRWVLFGPFQLYMAPLLLPSFLAACSVYARRRGARSNVAFAAALGASIALAAEPDASQALALLVGSAALFARYRSDALRSGLTLFASALITAWAFSRPDPLMPVPYVEGVFALALGRSLPAGLAVVASAVALVAGLCVGSLRGPPWLSAAAAYYAALFACGVAGLTPSPLIGFGAGPMLGFGLMVAAYNAIEVDCDPIA